MRLINRNIISAVILVFCSIAAGCMGSENQSNAVTATTVILIRHVERDNFFVVTAEGHARARALVDAVGEMGITAIYSPDLERNLKTVSPLAEHLKIKITLTPRISAPTIDKIVTDILTNHRGEVVLLVGNGSANLQALHQRLGGNGEGPYQYGDMFIYTISDNGRVTVIKSRYGS